jgi:hypothetical protein
MLAAARPPGMEPAIQGRRFCDSTSPSSSHLLIDQPKGDGLPGGLPPGHRPSRPAIHRVWLTPRDK